MTAKVGGIATNKILLELLKTDSDWMDIAINLAKKAYSNGEVPVGAIIVSNNQIVGKGSNQTNILNDATAHAEILAITAASSSIGDWRLTDTSIYVTKEPCAMCAGAIINARISRLIFGAYDNDKGCCGSLYQLCGDHRLGSKTAVKGGVREEICKYLLKDFFSSKRKKYKD
jgi:tRNA(adenine34) deaminase